MTMSSKQLIDHVKHSIKVGKDQSSKITQSVIDIEGMVCPKTKHFLNAICSIEDCRYLEVGSWQGASLVGAMYKNIHASAVAIDNFCRFDEQKINQSVLKRNIEIFLDDADLIFFNEDCWSIDLDVFANSFNIYFYDGSHLEKDQEMAFTYFNPVLDNTFVAIVDDWNTKATQRGTKKAFDILRYNVLFEMELSGRAMGCDNYVYVAVVQKP